MAPHEAQKNESEEAAATENVAADMAQAFKDLAKGESTAAAMENQLTSLESRIDDLLAMVDENSVLAKHLTSQTSKDSSNDEQNNTK